MYKLSSSLMSNLSVIIVIALAIIAGINGTNNCAAIIDTSAANIVLLQVLTLFVEYALISPAIPSPHATMNMEAVATFGEYSQTAIVLPSM